MLFPPVQKLKIALDKLREKCGVIFWLSLKLVPMGIPNQKSKLEFQILVSIYKQSNGFFNVFSMRYL